MLSSSGHFEADRQFSLIDHPLCGAGLTEGQSGVNLSDPVESPATPAILLDTPSSQAWLSDASIASYAGQELARVSQGDQHETAAHTHATVAGQTVSLYTHAGGITAHATNGPVSLRAHTDELQIPADKDVTILCVNGEIHINAQSKIELIGANSGVILDGRDITFVTPGTWGAKGPAEAMLGGASASASLPDLPDSRILLFDEQFKAIDSLTPISFVLSQSASGR